MNETVPGTVSLFTRAREKEVTPKCKNCGEQFKVLDIMFLTTRLPFHVRCRRCSADTPIPFLRVYCPAILASIITGMLTMLGISRLWLLVSEGTLVALVGIMTILGTTVTALATYVFLISLWIRRAKGDRQKN
jgi:prepilin signal peptidase PulO-like enzyme (type II secretory pathway)